ncbi:MAG: AAA family ATPase [Desulfovibrio sp.]
MLGMSRRRDDDERGKIIPIDLNTAGSQDSQPTPANPTLESLGEVVSKFQDAIEGAGLGRPAIEADGEIHRFDNPKSKSGNKNCWYIFFSDGVPAGHFGAWDENWSEPWSSKLKFEMTPEEWRRSQEQVAYAKEKKAKERALEADKAAQRANDLWTSSAETSEHPYLARKQVGAFGVRTNAAEGTLLIPMRNRYAEIRGVQSIPPQGKKRYLKGVAVDGVFHVIEGDSSTVYLCEGYATGASIHMATGAAVAVCFDTGNLPKAALNIREVFPKAKLIVAADDDRWSDRNSGITAANKAAQLVGADVVSPDFQDLSNHPTDFNDLHVQEGLDAVRAQVRGYSVRIKDWSLESLNDTPAPPVEWLVENLIPRSTVVVLAAVGGVGKSMIMLDMALKVSASPTSGGVDLNTDGRLCLGQKIIGEGPAILLCAEDSRDEIHRRAETLGHRFPRSLYCVTMPEMDRPLTLVNTVRGGSAEATPFWFEFVAQAETIKPALIVVDPLSCFIQADANDPAVGAYAMGLFQSLAVRTGASVVLVHHMSKMKDGIKSADAARAAIRGSTALVDHARGAYALWSEAEDKARATCQALGEDYARGKVVKGCLVKNNFRGYGEITDFVRQDNGLLISASDRLAYLRHTQWPRLLDQMETVIAHAAEQGHPFQHTGSHGVYELRERLPKPLCTMGKSKIQSIVRELLDTGRVAKHRPSRGGKSEVWLDVPTGPFADGVGELLPGEYEHAEIQKTANDVGKKSIPNALPGGLGTVGTK